jgi:hypothetical protein
MNSFMNGSGQIVDFLNLSPLLGGLAVISLKDAFVPLIEG